MHHVKSVEGVETTASYVFSHVWATGWFARQQQPFTEDYWDKCLAGNFMFGLF